jgi:hypothetical protein
MRRWLTICRALALTADFAQIEPDQYLIIVNGCAHTVQNPGHGPHLLGSSDRSHTISHPVIRGHLIGTR